MSSYRFPYPPLRWIEKAAQPEQPWITRFSESTPDETLLASCFAVLARETYGILDQLSDKQRQAWAAYLQERQSSEDGHFRDPLFSEADLARKQHNAEYLAWQTTFFSLAALHALDTRPLHPLRFLDGFLAENPLEAWMEALEWRDPWLVSNQIMFLASFLIGEWERCGNPAYREASWRIFDWLDATQNPQTGFWDLGRGADLHTAMAGAFHFYYLYFYLGRSVAHAETIIDNTLACQHSDGLFSPAGGGGACLDLDAVDILVKFSLLSDYRAVEVKTALRRSFEAILRNQNADGGFCEAKRPPLWQKSSKRKLIEAVGLDRLLKRPWQARPIEYQNYSGWLRMRHRIDQSDLWAAWFRPLALALISVRYPGEFIDDVPWRFHTSPALGWHDAAKMEALREKFSA